MQQCDKLLFVGCAPCQYWSKITGDANDVRKQKIYASRVGGGCDIEEGKSQAVVRNFIGDLPAINAGGQGNDPLHCASGLREKNLKRLRVTPESGLRDNWANDKELQIQAYRNKLISFFIARRCAVANFPNRF